MSKTNYDISKQMQRDLIEAYKQVYSSCWSQQQAYERMVAQPAPRFYVTPKQACSVISQMTKGDFSHVDKMKDLRKQMYYALFDVVVSLSEKREFIGKSLTYILKFAVAQPAPRFFISPVRGKIMRAFVRNGIFDENGKVRDGKLPSYVRTRDGQRKKRKRKKAWMLARMSRLSAAENQ